MTCSPAQLEANRRNGALSRGPSSSSGKAVSRRNGLKHGLTGAGIVLPEEDGAEVERRLIAFEEELKPTGGVERELVKRIALMTVRLDRSAEHETKAIAHRMRHAMSEFDEARLADVEHLLAWIASAPETNARRLRATPEGLAKLIEAIEALRADLAHPSGYRWDFDHCDRLHHLTGRRYTDVPITRIRALTEAVHGRFQHLGEQEGAGLGIEDRRRWAIAELVGLIDAEVAGLKGRLERFDREAIEQDRAEAPARAMFDGSKEGILARKYEAASERALYRALRELREIRADSAQVIEEEEVVAEDGEELGSSFPASPGESDESANVGPAPVPKRPDLAKIAKKGRRRANPA